MLILPDNLRRSRLISEDYRIQQVKLHANPDYGMASLAYASVVSKICNQYAVEELLDYGAGKGRLVEHLEVDHAMQVQMYDPAIPEWADAPEPCEMVACIDVLEHIEPDLLDNVLDDIGRVTKRIGIFSVTCEPAMKTLEDGRNAHLIVESAQWWLPKLMARFDLHMFQKVPAGFFVVVMAKDVVTQ